MKTNWLKYLSVLTLPLCVSIAFTSHGWLTFLPLLYVFGFIPLLELLFPPQPGNLAEAEEQLAAHDRRYDYLLYAMVPLQYAFLVFFAFSVQETGLSTTETFGRVLAMGLMCGVLGINVAHELGHRSLRYEQNLAKALLLSSLYMHFFIEHNRGHHRHVATEHDPASSRKNEWIYFFWLRSVVGSYLSAWQLEADRLAKKGVSALSLQNEMIVFQLWQLGLIGLFWAFFGSFVMLCFVGAAVIGFLLLETVNYIEHYGLSRQKKSTESLQYERVQPHHSWNSDHIVGRLLLFELSRHSDHHYLANRKYQVLRHHDHSPQMPTGYPGMMLMALFPPVWFWVMNPRVEALERTA